MCLPPDRDRVLVRPVTDEPIFRVVVGDHLDDACVGVPGIVEPSEDDALVLFFERVDPLFELGSGRYLRATFRERHDGHLSDSQGGHKPRTCTVEL